MDKSLLQRCRDAVRSVDESAEILLYGSRARGDAEVDSDYDLLIIVEGAPTLQLEERFREVLYPLELETGAVLTIFVVNRSQWHSKLYEAIPFYKNIKREGIFVE